MGHAGAIVSAVGESAQEKIDILTAAGITMAPNPSCIGETVAQVLSSHDLVGGSSRPASPLVDHL
jgi:malate-CoA ligase subunit alpha